MNPISRKLRAKTGASMLIALLFLMFCLFVGSSVLASATANSRRTAQNTVQQEFLSQRSAAMLMAEEIDGPFGIGLELTIADTVRTCRSLLTLPGPGTDPEPDPDAPATLERIIAFQAPFSVDAPMTAMQRLLYEGAVCRYLKEQNITVDGSATKVVLHGFWYQGTEITDMNSFWYPDSQGADQLSGWLTLEGPGDAPAAVTACFTFGDRNGYDFLVGLENAAINVCTRAAVSIRELVKPIQYLEDSQMGKIQLSETVTETYITWEKARIQKGGQDG